MTTLEMVIDELKSLPTEKLDRAAEYVHSLSRTKRAARLAALRASAGSLTDEEADELTKAIDEGCERVHERDW